MGNGSPCTKPAGAGTDHKGSGRCSLHGGKSKSGKQAAHRERANMVTRPLDIDPGQAILGAMRSAAGEVAWATAELHGMTDEELVSEQDGEHFKLRFKHRAEERLVKFARAAVDMGVEVAKVRIAQAQLTLMAQLVERVVERLDLDEEQRKGLGPAIRAELGTFVQGDAKEITDGR